ncbi:hypothetical protein_gp166 [Bacillus phage vB_BceM_WH1]|nr:hypothetical protein_gp166 [Bacillus phage vB_BceM_WH1]
MIKKQYLWQIKLSTGDVVHFYSTSTSFSSVYHATSHIHEYHLLIGLEMLGEINPI